MYLMTKRLLKLFIFMFLPVFLFACGSKSDNTSSGFITGFSAVRTDSSTIWAWGANGLGQLGNGTANDSAIPVKTKPFATNLIAIAVGGGHMLALDDNNGATTVWAWGYNASGQLGNTATVGNSSNPGMVSLPQSLVIRKIAAGSQHSLALDSNGTVWAWGANNSGQLGNNLNITPSATPAQVKDTDNNILGSTIPIVEIAAGNDFSLALDSNGVVWAWGNNANGQLGMPLSTTTTTQTSLGAVKVNGLSLANITKIAAGGAHALALGTIPTIDTKVRVWGWGYNFFGQLGPPVDTTNPSIFAAREITQLAGLVKDISAGSAHSMALSNDGTIVYAWGYNFYGQLGNGAVLKSEVAVPTLQTVMALNNAVMPEMNSIAAIGMQSLATDVNGNVWTWGYNGFGQLGDGTKNDRSLAQMITFP